MNRLDIIQTLINKVNANKYLEVGVCGGATFENVQCSYKVGVDPDTNSKATLHITSDEFFSSNNEKFDVIFIDGLHHSDQVYKDIKNALSCLNDGGYIVCHDMLPNEEITQVIPRQTSVWTGDCWKAWVLIRSEMSNLEMFVVDTDWGCGVIKRGSQKTISISTDLSWLNFLIHKQEWMNIISVDKFMDLIK